MLRSRSDSIPGLDHEAAATLTCLYTALSYCSMSSTEIGSSGGLSWLA